MRKLVFSLSLGLFVSLTACNRDPNQLAQVFESIEDEKWNWNQRVSHELVVTEPNKKVQITLQLRHADDYAYENLYLMLRLKQPNGRIQRFRVSLQLADENGQWLGKTSGATITLRSRLTSYWTLPMAGTYTLEIEQNMRDNPLLGIEDVGFEAKLMSK